MPSSSSSSSSVPTLSPSSSSKSPASEVILSISGIRLRGLLRNQKSESPERCSAPKFLPECCRPCEFRTSCRSRPAWSGLILAPPIFKLVKYFGLLQNILETLLSTAYGSANGGFGPTLLSLARLVIVPKISRYLSALLQKIR